MFLDEENVDLRTMKKKASLFFIVATVMIDMIGVGIILPVIPSLIEELTGDSISTASAYGGMLMVAYALMQFIFSPILGELSDKYGRRPILLISLLGLSIDYLLHALAPTIFWLFIGRILAGICGASHTTANAYVADISDPDEKAKNFGYLGAAFGMGFIIGPAIGGIFGDIDIRLPFYIASGLALANFLFGYFIVPESLKIEHRREIEPQKMIPGIALIDLTKFQGLILLILAFFLAHIAGQALPSIWSYHAMEVFSWGESQIGFSLMFVGLMVALVQGGLVSKAVKTMGEFRTILIGFAFWSLGMFLFSQAGQGWMLYAFMIPYALGGIAGPTLQGLMSNTVNADQQGKLQGGLTALMSITTIIGPAIATSLFYYYTQTPDKVYYPGASYLASSFILLTSTFLVWFGIKQLQNSSKKKV